MLKRFPHCHANSFSCFPSSYRSRSRTGMFAIMKSSITALPCAQSKKRKQALELANRKQHFLAKTEKNFPFRGTVVMRMASQHVKISIEEPFSDHMI